MERRSKRRLKKISSTLQDKREDSNPKELQEKLVAYVGFTRAREELIIVPTPAIKYHPMRDFMGVKHILAVVNYHKPLLIKELVGGEAK